MVKKVIFFIFSLPLLAQLECKIENEKIICTYFIDRSDNTNGLHIKFHWYSPNGIDDRIRLLEVPPLYGSVYDYRFLPGRAPGKWVVEAIELETNKTSKTTFDINSSDDSFFAD